MTYVNMARNDSKAIYSATYSNVRCCSQVHAHDRTLIYMRRCQCSSSTSPAATMSCADGRTTGSMLHIFSKSPTTISPLVRVF